MDGTDPAVGGGPPAGVMAHWDDVMADVAATAEEYREAGWDVTTLHPGDVHPLPHATVGDDIGDLGGDPGTDSDADAADDGTDGDDDPEFVGLDVVVPGDEFTTLERVVADASFDEYETYRTRRGGVVFLVIAMQSAGAGRTVLLPVYYATNEARRMAELARERGRLRTRIRPLSDERRVVFTQVDPGPLLPTTDTEGSSEGEGDGRGD
jgi:hypothetical protein